jgi:predicted permease
MSAFVGDVRFALRMLRKQTGFTVVVVVALALGLAVSATVFGAVQTLLLRPLPVNNPQQLASVFIGPASAPRVWDDSAYADYVEMSRDSSLFSGLAASSLDACALSAGETHQSGNAEQAEFAFGEWVSGNYFEVLGVTPTIGRTFTAAEAAAPGAQPTVVISDALWRRRFHAQRSVLGRALYLNGTRLTILGVMPPTFRTRRLDLDFWVPLQVRVPFGYGEEWITDRTQRDLKLLGRLRSGISLEAAEAGLNVLARQLAAQYPATNADTKVTVVSELEGRYRGSYPAVQLGCTMALLVAALVLFISCANAANLLLARAAARTREFGIRIALGASRTRIIRLLLTESLLLALLAGGLGLVLAFWLCELLRLLLPRLPLQFRLELHPDLRTFGAVFALSVLAGVASGVLPAWRAARADVVSSLKTDTGAQGQTVRRAGLRELLVVGQLSVSIIVVVSGGLFLRSLQHLGSIDPGFRTDNLASAFVDPGLFDYTPAQQQQFLTELTARLERVPGVQSVSSALFVPIINVRGFSGPVVREGEPPPLPNHWTPVYFSIIYPKYFETIGTKLLLGRDFEPSEREGAPSTIVINAELARRLFGTEQDALGKRLRIGDADAPLLEVVGVAQDGKYMTLFEDPTPWMYLPSWFPALHFDSWTVRNVLVRATDAHALPGIVQALRSEVAKFDARLPVTDVTLAEHHLDFVLSDALLAANLGAVVGLVALALAALGMYSVMTYAVSQRTKEIGIRMALGATTKDVVRLVVGQAVTLIVIGTVLGSVGAFLVSRLLSRFLFGVPSGDALTFASALLTLTGVSLVATLIPTRRATRVSPTIALRYE